MVLFFNENPMNFISKNIVDHILAKCVMHIKVQEKKV